MATGFSFVNTLPWTSINIYIINVTPTNYTVEVKSAPNGNDGTLLFLDKGGGEEEPFSCCPKFFHLWKNHPDYFYFSPNK